MLATSRQHKPVDMCLHWHRHVGMRHVPMSEACQARRRRQRLMSHAKQLSPEDLVEVQALRRISEIAKVKRDKQKATAGASSSSERRPK